MPDTIRSTAKNAGLLDIRMVPERHNSVKVLLFFDKHYPRGADGKIRLDPAQVLNQSSEHRLR